MPDLNAASFLSGINGTTWFIGFWVALLALTLFERKGAPRRVPIWAGLALAAVAMFAVPKLLDTLTGSYQDASLKADVNACLKSTPNGTQLTVSNSCTHPIVVGLCQSNERNPEPCRQSIQLTPGGTTALNANGETRAALPSSPNGYTIVACRVEHRPSRTKKVGGKGHRGVCLP